MERTLGTRAYIAAAKVINEAVINEANSPSNTEAACREAAQHLLELADAVHEHFEPAS